MHELHRRDSDLHDYLITDYASLLNILTDLGSRTQMGEDPRVLLWLQTRSSVRPHRQGASDAACALSRIQAHHQDEVFAQVCI